MGWAQESHWTLWKEKELSFLPEIDTPLLSRPACSLILISTEQLWLINKLWFPLWSSYFYLKRRFGDWTPSPKPCFEFDEEDEYITVLTKCPYRLSYWDSWLHVAALQRTVTCANLSQSEHAFCCSGIHYAHLLKDHCGRRGSHDVRVCDVWHEQQSTDRSVCLQVLPRFATLQLGAPSVHSSDRLSATHCILPYLEADNVAFLTANSL
jgi:hypothetical protein